MTWPVCFLLSAFCFLLSSFQSLVSGTNPTDASMVDNHRFDYDQSHTHHEASNDDSSDAWVYGCDGGVFGALSGGVVGCIGLFPGCEPKPPWLPNPCPGPCPAGCPIPCPGAFGVPTCVPVPPMAMASLDGSQMNSNRW